MTEIFVREMRGTSIYKDIEETTGGKPHENGGKDWGGADSNQGVLRVTNNHQKQGKRR